MELPLKPILRKSTITQKYDISYILLLPDEIDAIINALAKQISSDYTGDIHMVGVLAGCFQFLPRLANKVENQCTFEFIEAKSYCGTESKGKVQIKKDIEDIAGKQVLIVEDIVDTGRTIHCLRNKFQKQKPASLKVCTLLSKPSRREIDVEIEYIGAEIPNEFVVGFGMDYNEKYRDVPFVGVLK